MWDIEGKKYYDFLGGFATLNQGHCHPKIIKAMTDQVSRLHHTSRAIFHDCLYELNEFLTKQFDYDKVLNMNTGKNKRYYFSIYFYANIRTQYSSNDILGVKFTL